MKDKRIAEALMDIGALSLVDTEHLFTWVSGIRSPIYCDNRKIISYPELRKKVAAGLVEKIRCQYPDVAIIAATATAGIPHGAWVADQLDKPMIYVRSSSKGHGLQNMIEGVCEKGQRCVLIEDLISTGKSSLTAVRALREAGLIVEKVFAIFTYNFPEAGLAFEREGIDYEALTDYETLVPLAIERGLVAGDQAELLMAWRQNPRLFTEDHHPQG